MKRSGCPNVTEWLTPKDLPDPLLVGVEPPAFLFCAVLSPMQFARLTKPQKSGRGYVTTLAGFFIHLSQGVVWVMLLGLGCARQMSFARTQAHAFDGKLYDFSELRSPNSVV
jgi:hypothetical protein